MNGTLARIDLDALRSALAGQQPVAWPAGPGQAAIPAGQLPRPIGIDHLADGPGAVGQIGEILAGVDAGSGPVVVLAAATPMTVRGSGLRETIERLIGGRYGMTWVVLGPADGAVHADERTVAAARTAADGAACVVTVGSGTITDIGKAATPAGTCLVAVQTATSVNGYADPFSVLLRDGVKRTTPSRWPDALIIDHDVLAGAPAELNLAGLGDMAAMFTATADWYLASAMRAGGPPYLAQVASLVRTPGERMFELAGEPGRLAELARLLTLSGITMGVAGSTAPASGMEHAVSHLLEMAATAGRRPGTGSPDGAGSPDGTGGQHGSGGPDGAAGVRAGGNLHGTVVGVASIAAAATWAHVRQRIADGALGRPAGLPDPDQVAGQIGAAFADLDPTGAMAAECLADYSGKLRLLATRADPLAALRSGWDRLDADLGRLLTDPATLAAGLRSAGLPVRFDDLPDPVDSRAARWAVSCCALQRSRFGVADLAMLLGAWTPDDVDSVLAAAAGAADAADAA
jgi:glycerol-1-phosphate dehydrogenase [NAD(P)+]